MIPFSNNPGSTPTDPRLKKLPRADQLQLERAAYAQQVPVSWILDQLEQQQRQQEEHRRQDIIGNRKPSYRNGVLFLDGVPATPAEVAAYDKRNPYLAENWKKRPEMTPEQLRELQQSQQTINERNSQQRQQQMQSILQTGMLPGPPPATINPNALGFQMPVPLSTGTPPPPPQPIPQPAFNPMSLGLTIPTRLPPTPNVGTPLSQVLPGVITYSGVRR